MTTTADKIARIKALAERGATEGERAAAREALKRIETRMAKEAPDDSDILHHRPGPQSGVTGFGHLTPEDIDRIYDDVITGAKQSTAPHHHGRVWFDTNG